MFIIFKWVEISIIILVQSMSQMRVGTKMMTRMMMRDLNENIRQESNNNDDEGGKVEVGVSHQGGVHVVIQRL